MTATILVVAALKLSQPVTLPFAAALCIAMVAWPVQAWLEPRVRRWAAFAVTLLAVLAAAAVVAGAILWTFGRLAGSIPELMQRLEELSRSARELALRYGVELPGDAVNRPGDQLGTKLVEGAATGWRRAYSIPMAAGLVLAFLAFVLLETRDFQRKIRQRLHPSVGDRILETTSLVAHQVRRHFVALTITSGISGLLTAILALSLGLNFAIAWGVIAWILNYIPTIGPILSVIPPTLYALLQFDGFTRPLVVLVGTAIIQFTMGNFIDPKIEGRILSMSPLLVLLSVVFWGWVWGIAGAFLAVPLTAAIIVACGQFEGTRWIAALCSDDSRREADQVSG